MATIPKTKFGHLACYSCGDKVVIRQSATGTLTGTCQECGFQHLGKKHDDSYSQMLKKITRKPGAEEPAPAPPAAPAKQPAAAPAAPAPTTMASAPVSKRNTCFG